MKSLFGVGTTFTFILKLKRDNINMNQINLENTDEIECDSKKLYFNWKPQFEGKVVKYINDLDSLNFQNFDKKPELKEAYQTA